MGNELVLCGTIATVIFHCASEREFDAFMIAVSQDRGWDWLFAHRVLGTKVVLPPPSPYPTTSVPDQLAFELFLDVQRKGWTLSNQTFGWQPIHQPPEPLSSRNLAIGFFQALAQSLATQAAAARYSDRGLAGTRLQAPHESNVTVRPVGGPAGVHEICGDISNGWNARHAAFAAVLQRVGPPFSGVVGQSLAGISARQVGGLLGGLVNDAGSCLVGVLVADVTYVNGQQVRLVAAAANMCQSRGSYVPQTTRGQGSQIHMEIFLLERLGAVLGQLGGEIHQLDAGILGVKTNSVVSENVMCGACAATKNTEIDGRLTPPQQRRTTFSVCFVGP